MAPGEDAKPSPMAPPDPPPAAAKTEPPRRPSDPAVAATQPITIISSPGGARAVLDGRPDAVCTTPCSVDAAPGRHTIAVSLDGYQTEYREVDVTSSPVEMTAVVLRARGGALMLTSEPRGAHVLVNGKPTGKTTPVRLDLAPGSYKITVELDGRQASHTVQIGGGISSLKITM
jgi:hypothetical protein